MPSDTPNIAGISRDILASQSAPYQAEYLSQAAADHVDDYRAAVNDLLSTGEQAERDIAELQSKRDLIPGPGYERLRGEAMAEAQRLAADADARATRALDALKADLIADAQPTVDPAREGLARQEAALAMGEATRDGAVERLNSIVTEGSPEAAAVLLGTSFGRTMLVARGVNGHDLQQALETGRMLAAHTAVERGTTARQVLAGKLLQSLGGLAAAKGAAGSYVANILKDATR
jgi:hypothetical protein